MKTDKELQDEIERFKLNVKRTNIDLKKEVYNKAIDLLQSQLYGRQEERQRILDIIERYLIEESDNWKFAVVINKFRFNELKEEIKNESK